MKHLKTFENFVNEDITNEIWGQEFFTGHPKGGKEVAKQKILSDIESGIQELMADPKSYAYSSDPEKLKNFLIKQAKDNNWRGTIEPRTSPKDGLIYLTYMEGKTTFQQAVAPMAAGTEVMATR
jgi:hypothetical protein